MEAYYNAAGRSGIKKEKTNEQSATKEQIAALRQEKKKMQEELDELRGQTTSGRITCVLAFLCALLLLSGIFVELVKMDAGNFASEVLAPMIGDVPVIRNILPTDLQLQSPKEIAASEQAASEQAALDDYVSTYSKMSPKSAAQVFDNMMTDRASLVVKILENMTPAKRAAILSNMSVANASQVTVMMEQ